MAKRKKLIEVALPLDDINKASAREKSIRHGHPSTLHLWWARRPLAAARAVIFAQMVDDPSSLPNLTPTEVETERERLFGIMRDLIVWENTTNEAVLNRARKEIRKSWERTAAETGEAPSSLPPFHDPFAGGGALPLEAQRLGFHAHASDLNPVAVMINKAMIEIPQRFLDHAPIGPIPPGEQTQAASTWKGSAGLAEDVRRYGHWVFREAAKRIGQFYPTVDLPNKGGDNSTVIAWIWARTVESPNPAFSGVHVPLVSSFLLSSKKGKEAWIEPIVQGREYSFRIHHSKPANIEEVKSGTKLGRGAQFKCLVSGTNISASYVKEEARAGRLGARLMAIVAEGPRGRSYCPPNQEAEDVANSAQYSWSPEYAMPQNPRWFSPPDYGMPDYADLFTARQLLALNSFSDLVREARNKAINDAIKFGLAEDSISLNDGGNGATAFGDAIAAYLSFVVDKCADYWSSICSWHSSGEKMRNVFGRQAIPMVWDYAECNPFSNSTGNWIAMVDWVWKALAKCNGTTPSTAKQLDAMTDGYNSPCIISTDPPYYDNIGYADLSDFFYVWLRENLKEIVPDLFSTMLVPKAEELVATPYRHGGRQQAEEFFITGMTKAMGHLAKQHHKEFPTTIYYAFKQAEQQSEGIASTGWATFLEAIIRSGLSITGTWPMRTELGNRLVGKGTNALASSVVLVCRHRPDDSEITTRSEFVRNLADELPLALQTLQEASIAPVDMAQAAIGPGMAIFSRYMKVLENDGSAMSVQTALQLINKELDDYLSRDEGDYDDWTSFAIRWFEQYGLDSGSFGIAEDLARARGISVEGVVRAGILESKSGKVSLLHRDDLDPDWDPATDDRLTVWEAAQYLIRALADESEVAAASLLKRLGAVGVEARSLSYRLFSICERKGWADEAIAYNSLIVAWPRLSELMKQQPEAAPGSEPELF